MSESGSFDWDDWFDPEVLESERLDADIEMMQLEGPEDYVDYYEHGDMGGVDDGFGNIISDADPGL